MKPTKGSIQMPRLLSATIAFTALLASPSYADLTSPDAQSYLDGKTFKLFSQEHSDFFNPNSNHASCNGVSPAPISLSFDFSTNKARLQSSNQSRAPIQLAKDGRGFCTKQARQSKRCYTIVQRGNNSYLVESGKSRFLIKEQL